MLRLLACVAASIIALAPSSIAADESRPSFAVGQEWTIKSSPPSPIRVVIGRIEAWNGLTAISVSILNVPCPPQMPCKTTAIAHAPFDESALAKSVDAIVATNVAPAPEFEDGYAGWKSNNGGVFTVDVAKVAIMIFESLAKGIPSQTQ